MILDRYLFQEITVPLLLGCGFLILIFTSYSAAVYLSDAVIGLLPLETVGHLILLRTLIGLEVLLPTGLYVAVVSALGRMGRDSEMIALSAAGVSELRILGSVLGLSVIVALLVAVLSLLVHPWAYRMGYLLEIQAQAEINVNKLPAGRFYPLAQAQGVLFAERVDRDQHRLERVFLERDRGRYSSVVYAREALLPSFGEERTPNVILFDGYAYDLDREGNRDTLLRFNTLNLYLTEEPAKVGYRRKAQPTSVLARSSRPEDIAELQWRISTPLATILLGALAVPLSRANPRQGRHRNMLVAVAIYALYFNLGGMVKTWVEEGWIGTIPGMLWVHLLPLLLLFYLLARSRPRAHRPDPGAASLPEAPSAPTKDP